MIAGSSLLGGCASLFSGGSGALEPMSINGPASRHVPMIHAAFVRRKEEYGMWWPGAVYDGEAARRMYTARLKETAASLGIELSLRPAPIYSNDEADAWLAHAKEAGAEGLMVVLLDRQQHAWPTAHKAVDSGIPTVIFSPVGSSFTTNTIKFAEKTGCVIYSTDDFTQPAYGMRMLWAGARIRRARCIVLKGDNFSESRMDGLGITLRRIPAKTFLDDYRRMQVTEQVSAMAASYMDRARVCRGVAEQDVINGARAYHTARGIIEREQGDAITMDCLGALWDAKESLPCLAWSRMNDEGIPAACEADSGAVASHILVQALFDRPGFQQDPVADTSGQAIIGAHCSCPTRLNGFDRPPEPFDLIHHHANRDATARTLWKEGTRVTSLDVLPGNGGDRSTELLISAGTVVRNVDVPPSGGCVVSVKVKFDGDQEVLNFPGFHQLFFYGDYKRHLVEYCRLFKLDARVV